MANLNDNEEEYDVMTLTLEDDSEMECIVLSTFDAGSHTYVALLPTEALENDDDEEGEIYLYRYVQGEGDEFELENIEDDDEFELVQEAFDELLDEEEFNDID